MGLSFTKLYSLFFKTEIRIGMVGLDAAGKTTILYKLKFGKIVTTIPTVGFNNETLEYKNISFIVWDAGTYAMFRMQSVMSHSYRNIKGLIFVVDSADRERVVDAKDELHRIILKDGLKDKALIVFANKQDLPGLMNTDEFIEKLDLHSLGTTKLVYPEHVCHLGRRSLRGSGLAC